MFPKAIADFKRLIQNQPQFQRCLERKYVANNYVESRHSQLETIYFNRARIKKLDCLILTFTNDVERVHFNNNVMLIFMIFNLLGETGSITNDYNSELHLPELLGSPNPVQAFVFAEAVTVEQDSVSLNNKRFQEQSWTGKVVLMQMKTNIATRSVTMYHGFEDLRTLRTIPGLDQTKADTIDRALADVMIFMVEYRRNPNLGFIGSIDGTISLCGDLDDKDESNDAFLVGVDEGNAYFTIGYT
ncbi:hypothetical protein PHYBLDRAFT_140748 [Phycomyces blakesleeanus NRRL 1555(-)]|uniref:Uncharacterized protein n=1 Tax=Phycomyces blakesleeanus (strain ATCC 8743b / DSM 1359 / FGSC 10004 / NBRC 33097 / NRRL 1555) TaxID=763407 RepID=A0A163B7L7_PHYB8|nr:hypothetical protein PHYBLDRAFT_140748 [Phycomyces blakesleeanus NRRL 1555(-)]OAD78691.1 hypothetical protein PHYBLDRAFT_140748 [Phycomyces blakesleeanus NRRL 1555(-)]|eukprot:XP_018296731.1 hypothetical protein PHYBLDRAFT_140748 [Phycomyces blakesleeanus NRRL 1555(-)]